MLIRTILFFLAAMSSMAYSAIQPAPTDIARQSSEPVVQVILFWEQECPKCEQLLEGFLPAFQLAHGEQFSIEMIEVVSVDDINRLFQIGAAYGLSKNQVGVPLMIVGDYALVGATQIPAELPALVEAYLASGGVLTRLRELPQEGVAIAEEVKDDGMWLAWLTMAVMAAGLLLAGWQIWRAFDGEAVFRLPPWTGWLTPVLVVLGIGVAVYLTFIETTKVQAICGPVGDCNAVQNSKYAMLFGLIPVGVLGLLGYLGILAFWFAQRLRMGILAEYAPVVILGLTVFGTAFSVYLTYLEIFVIDAVCIWCISSAWIMTGLMVLSLPAAVSWLAGAEEDAA